MESREEMIRRIKELKKERGAVIMAHYYQRGEIQDLADYVGDSLALARQAAQTDAGVIVMCGVHFMAETAALLCPGRIVLVPDVSAGCSLADSCPAEEFAEFVRKHPDHTVVSYVNTSAAVKALTDIVVTSGNARKVIDSLPADEKIIFGPDRNLGDYINAQTGRHMVLWDGACHVHDRFDIEGIIALRREHPAARVLVHPECKRHLQLMGDVVGSTAVLLDCVKKGKPGDEFIVVTESGILHQMRAACPDKVFYEAPYVGSGQRGCACNQCEHMKLNTLEKLKDCLENLSPRVEVDPSIADAALRPIRRMLELS